MMKTRVAAFALSALMTSGIWTAGAIAQGPPPGEGWDRPPAEFHDVEQRGFRDGIVGAEKDFDNHRRPTPENRDEFRKPAVPRHDVEAYRRGFERGYQVGWDHSTGGNGPRNGYMR